MNYNHTDEHRGNIGYLCLFVCIGGCNSITSQFEVDTPHSLMYQGGVMRKTNPSFLNGVPELLVLKLLSRREMYGYEIVQAIQAETMQALSFGEGCIYPYLHYLESARLVTTARKEIAGRSRCYYRLTDKGRIRLVALAEDWQRVAAGISLVMGGQNA
jgi:PadR family transcriptional regulator, regulatory protein PadR